MRMEDKEQFFEKQENSELVVIQINAFYGGVRCYIEKTISYEESFLILNRIKQLTAENGGYFIFSILDAKTLDSMSSLYFVYKNKSPIAS